jgi:hypothetical protein
MSIIAALIAQVGLAWVWALATGWVLPVVGGSAGAIILSLVGGDWWLAIIAGVGIAGFVFIWLRWGLKLALAWGAIAAAFFIDQNAARRGAARQSARERRDADKRAIAREKTVQDVLALPDAELRRRARRFVRSS